MEKEQRKRLLQRTRVRLEFTAYPAVSGARLLVDKKLTALRVLLKERFGEPGQGAWEDWLRELAQDQQFETEARQMTGGTDGAA